MPAPRRTIGYTLAMSTGHHFLRRFVAGLVGLVLVGILVPVVSAETPARPVAAAPSLLLVASRQITHPSFHEAVVLVTRHGRGGPIGVIVNRPLEIPLKSVFPALAERGADSLYQGGPVEPQQLSFLFRGGDAPAGTLVVAEQTYIARDPSLLSDLLLGLRPHTGLRVIAGYAGWAPGQLENEIARGDWHLLPVDSAALFDRPVTTMWADLYRRATQKTACLAAPAASDGEFRRCAAMLLSTLATTLPR